MQRQKNLRLTSTQIKLIEAEIELRERINLLVQERWSPLPGPQTLAFNSAADVLFYGGSAGGGKTDLLLGTALRNHNRSIIFRRDFQQMKGIIDRADSLFAGLGGSNKVDKLWTLDVGSKIELGAVLHDKDRQKYMGRAHDLKGFDEITHFPKAYFVFLIGWLRSVIKGQRKRVICTGNPPMKADERWVISYWAPWLDPSHPKRAMAGELRYFAIINDEEVELESGDPFEHIIKGVKKIIRPKSRTFIPASLSDNPFLSETGYEDQLRSLPPELSRILLDGDFQAGIQDDVGQVIPSEWLKIAQERWKKLKKPDVPLTHMGVDVARGGSDKTVITNRYGWWVDRQHVYPGSNTPDGDAARDAVNRHHANSPIINVDVIGVGASAYDSIKATYKNKAVPLNASEGSDQTDLSGMLTFLNCRAEWWWKFREALDPKLGKNLAIPDDDELFEDLCSATWTLSGGKIQISDKDKMKKRLGGRSPDKGDSLIYAFAEKVIEYPQIRDLE